ncbi:MAG: carboxymuconolactone decarboxylase family protein [Opitutae bacterium]|nr:carboxymuconolactone decarboxylase family protein [Opitutae bacterium]
MNTTASTESTVRPAHADLNAAAPEVLQAMLALQQAVNQGGLESSLLELVRLRASQINRCAFCIDMHFREARTRGEHDHRLYLLDAWEEVSVYSPRERAALRWTEALTRLPGEGVPDAVFAAVRPEFTDAELFQLTLAIVAINGWNRLNVGFRVPPGGF